MLLLTQICFWIQILWFFFVLFFFFVLKEIYENFSSSINNKNKENQSPPPPLPNHPPPPSHQKCTILCFFLNIHFWQTNTMKGIYFRKYVYYPKKKEHFWKICTSEKNKFLFLVKNWDLILSKINNWSFCNASFFHHSYSFFCWVYYWRKNSSFNWHTRYAYTD